MKDIFAIQDDIATSIAESLLDTLVPVKTTYSSDVRAYDYYIRGRQFFNRFRKKDIEFARQMFRQALDVDPAFALAWAGYADCFSFLMMYVDPKDSYCEEASNASVKALELNPDLAEAHASRGLAYLISEEFELAEAEFEKAIELNPRLFEAYYYYGRTRFHQGDLQMAADYFAKAAEVNPNDYQSRFLRVQILRGLGRTEEALNEAKQSIAAALRSTWNGARTTHVHCISVQDRCFCPARLNAANVGCSGHWKSIRMTPSCSTMSLATTRLWERQKPRWAISNERSRTARSALPG